MVVGWPRRKRNAIPVHVQGILCTSWSSLWSSYLLEVEESLQQLYKPLRNGHNIYFKKLRRLHQICKLPNHRREEKTLYNVRRLNSHVSIWIKLFIIQFPFVILFFYTLYYCCFVLKKRYPCPNAIHVWHGDFLLKKIIWIVVLFRVDI